MSVEVGGIYVAGVSTRVANQVCQELGSVNGDVDFDDYVVDLCFMTYVEGGLGADYAAGVGIRPGMVGRTQRRFIINLEVPPGMADRQAYATWITQALTTAAEIVRDVLPRRSKKYPAERLAAEVLALRERWISHIR